MQRVPNTGPGERRRAELVRRYESLLKALKRIPPRRRENECADVREDICRTMLGELGAPGYAPVQKPRAAAEIIDIDELLAGVNRR